jgi:hypothetical protein
MGTPSNRGEPVPAATGRVLIEGASAEVVAERTSMPLEIVEQIACV